ncbi:amidohydrolase family protein [Acetomicrobium sp.]|uniref:amidohydrolase family protein n=1 Tax=Acetomicrobium sp. TaxID=1872099 RepID=UPI002FCAE5BB
MESLLMALEESPIKEILGILNGKIEVIIAEENSSSSIEAANFLDARGHVVCPGFIDMHSHSDLQIFLDSPSDAKVRQGITTELLGQDGLGPAPVNKDSLNTIKGLLAGLDGMLPDEKWTWQTFSDYLNAIESSELFSNVAVLLCQGPIRIEAMGMEERQPTSQELEKMKYLIWRMHGGRSFWTVFWFNISSLCLRRYK